MIAEANPLHFNARTRFDTLDLRENPWRQQQ
jgi:hypothetical protein